MKTGRKLFRAEAEIERLRETLDRIAAYGDRDPKWLMTNAYAVLAEVIMLAAAKAGKEHRG